MDLDFSEEQEMLREMVRRVCAEGCPLPTVRALEDDPIGYSLDFWKQLGELGVLGLLIPEAHGGAGQSLLEGALVYEELGRALSPSPHFASCVMSAGVFQLGGSEEQRKSWLPRLASGEAILTPAWLEPRGGFGPRGVQLAATRDGAGYRLCGVKRHVPFASTAERLLVLARSGEGEEDVQLFLVDPQAPGVHLLQQHSLASDTQYRVDFDGVRVTDADRIEGGWALWERVLLDGAILLAAQAMGGAERALEMTVEYAKQRKQFDKPLGAFQAIAHHLADAATRVDGGKTLVYETAWARASGRPFERLAAMAKLFACETFRGVTAMAQQVFGGVGFTIEYDIQLYFRRAKQLELSWWDARALEERVARSVLDASP